MTTRFENGFAGRTAVVTGGGTGMGRELVRLLAADGCDVATCDVLSDNLADTVGLCAADGSPGEVMSFVADVSDETQVLAFRDAVAKWRPRVHVLFNNAGIGGGGSVVHDEDRESWDKTFAVCFFGVYYNTRAFMPLLVQADVAHIVNTSSVNGFWASLGPNTPHSAYSSAKFAVKGFSEALITDLQVNAPHVHVSVVMPGHIGTSIVINSGKILGFDPKEMTEDQLQQVRVRAGRAGLDLSGVSDEDIRVGIIAQGEAFRDAAPTSAREAADIMLDAVRRDEWRVLVGDDAHVLDEEVRSTPRDAYTAEFFARLQSRNALGFARG
jgi:NAD(P)-dependent dehydrogenase (short-subunit alcohol dehydrogenase family)